MNFLAGIYQVPLVPDLQFNGYCFAAQGNSVWPNKMCERNERDERWEE